MNNTDIQNFISQNNLDVVAGINEMLINDVSKKYFLQNRETQLFKGSSLIEQLDLRFDYQFNEEPKIDFKPLSNTSEDDISGSVSRVSGKFYSIQSGNLLASITVDASISGNVKYAGNILTFEADDVIFNINDKELNIEKHNNCDLNNLIEHILQVFLKDQINLVCASIPIPNPPDLITGFRTSIQTISFDKNNILVGLKVLDKSFGLIEDIETQSDLFDSIYSSNPKIVESIDLDKIKDEPEEVDFEILNFENVKENTLGFDIPQYIDDNSKSLPTGDYNLFVAFSNNAFQRLADLQFNRRTERRESGRRWWYVYGASTTNSKVSIINRGLRIITDISLWGDAEAEALRWPIRVKVGMSGRSNQNATINASLLTRNANREIWLNPSINFRGINIRFRFRPRLIQWVIGWLLNLILRGLGSIVLGLLSLISRFIKIKLFTLPTKLPLSNITVTPEKVTLGNWDNKLFIALKIK